VPVISRDALSPQFLSTWAYRTWDWVAEADKYSNYCCAALIAFAGNSR
jgi:hypothetical protein